MVIDAHDGEVLRIAAQSLETALAPGAGLIVRPGDVTDAAHQVQLAQAADELTGLELVVNNASTLGPSPSPPLTHYPVEALREGGDQPLAPLGLIQATFSQLERAARPGREHDLGRIGGGLPRLGRPARPGGPGPAGTGVLAAEQPRWRVWSVDPGDLRTRMHQDAFPGEDISDRPEPATAIPALLALIGSDHPSGRVRLADLMLSGRAS